MLQERAQAKRRARPLARWRWRGQGQETQSPDMEVENVEGQHVVLRCAVIFVKLESV